MMRNSVLLPQPDGPSRLTNSPRLDVEIDAVERRQARAEALADARASREGNGEASGDARSPAQTSLSSGLASRRAC